MLWIKILFGPLVCYVGATQSGSFLPSAQASLVLGVLLWMIVWWVLDIVPLFVTALLPIILFPLFQIQSLSEVTQAYGSDIIFLFLGGFLIAGALEKWELHKQISRGIIQLFGQQPSHLILGFIVATGFLSLWISNTASAMIMLPLAAALFPTQGSTTSGGQAFTKALKLGIAYAASIGGIGTIIGSPPNAFLVGYLQKTSGIEIGFFKWMLFGIPLAALGLVILWLYLTRWAYRVSDLPSLKISLDIQRVPFSLSQRRVCVLFVLAVVGWIMRPLLDIPGLTDVHIGLGVGILMFLTPSSSQESSPTILEASDIHRVDWSVLLLFGGGLALSQGIEKSGLDQTLVHALQDLQHLPSIAALFLICSVTIIVTEFASNTAVAAIFIPLLAGLGVSLALPELMVLMTVTMAASLSFMLPMATPPNAVVFSRGGFSVREMIRVGFWLNIIFACLITLATYFVLPLVW